MGGHSAGVNSIALHPSDLLWSYGPALLALVVAGVGGWLMRGVARGRAGVLGAVCAGAALVGWVALLLPGWRAVWWPVGVGQRLFLAAIVVGAGAALAARVRTRWLGVGVAMFAAAWIAQPAVRAEFWRMWFAGLVAAWILTRTDVRRPSLAVATGLALVFGLVVAGASGVWVGVALVLLGAAGGMLVGGKEGAVPPVLVMSALLAVEMGAGRAMRGGGGVVDVLCVGCVLVPWGAPRVEAAIRGRMRRGAPVLAPVVTAGVAVGLVWVVARVLRLV